MAIGAIGFSTLAVPSGKGKEINWKLHTKSATSFAYDECCIDYFRLLSTVCHYGNATSRFGFETAVLGPDEGPRDDQIARK